MTLATRAALRAVATLEPIEADTQAKIDALESERALLAPYQTTAGFRKLRERIDEIRSHLVRLRGLPGLLED